MKGVAVPAESWNACRRTPPPNSDAKSSIIGPKYCCRLERCTSAHSTVADSPAMAP